MLEKNKKISIGLLKLWIACLILLSIGVNIYISCQQVFAGVDPTVFVSGLHLFLAGILMFVFIPLLCIIYHFSKKSGSAVLKMAITVLLVWLISTTVLLVFSIVLAYITQNTI